MDLILNLILIPKMASTGAAIGTMAAEVVVWIVQYAALRDLVREAYQSIRYVPVLGALLLGSAASVWVKGLHMGNFTALMISAILFFGIYGIVLTIWKEPLVLEIEGQVFRKIVKKGKEKK